MESLWYRVSIFVSMSRFSEISCTSLPRVVVSHILFLPVFNVWKVSQCFNLHVPDFQWSYKCIHTFISLSGTFCELPLPFICPLFDCLVFHIIYRDHFKILDTDPWCLLSKYFLPVGGWSFRHNFWCLFHFNGMKSSVFYLMVCIFGVNLRKSFPANH